MIEGKGWKLEKRKIHSKLIPKYFETSAHEMDLIKFSWKGGEKETEPGDKDWCVYWSEEDFLKRLKEL